jgi:PKD repeat protein
LPPQVDSDLFVSPDGDDNNAGTCETTPLKTIDRASRLIFRNQSNPNTIHLLAGIYSFGSDEQKFPVQIPGNVYIQGAGTSETKLLGNSRLNVIGSHQSAKIKISDMQIINFGNNNAGNLFCFFGGTTYLENLLFENNRSSGLLFFQYSKNVYISNSIIKNGRGSALFISIADSLNISGLYIDNIREPFYNSNCIRLTKVNYKNISNLSITNCNWNNVEMLIHADWGLSTGYNPVEQHRWIFNNVLIANNTVRRNPEFIRTALVRLYDMYHGYQEINNWTVANNQGANSALQISGVETVVNNSIFYNPDLLLNNEISFATYFATLLINNSLLYKIHNLDFWMDRSTNSVFEISPQFMGMIDDTISPTSWEYYPLHESSPCIDTGTININFPDNFPQFDLAGNPRISGLTIDMGAFEFDSNAIAHFEAYPLSGYAPLTVQFHDTYQIDRFMWEWDFNLDGSIDSNEPAPTHTYTTPGVYSVRLIVNDGEFIGTKINYITVLDPDLNENEKTEIPVQNALFSNYPNPFNPTTSISFSIERDGFVSLDIYNIRGQKIKSLVSENKATGNHSVVWNGTDESGRNVGSGIYFYRIITDKFTSTKKMVLMK